MSEQAKKDARNLWLPVGAVIAICGSVLFFGVAWGSMNGDVNKLKSDMADLKSAITEMRDTSKVVSQLSVKIDMLTAAQEKTAQKVDDIRVMVRD